MDENKSFLIKYLAKLEKSYHRARMEFFRSVFYHHNVKLFPRFKEKETMFGILKQKIENPDYNISNKLLKSLGEGLNNQGGFYLKRSKKVDLNYNLLFKLDDLLALIIYDYFSPFSQKFNAFLELISVLSKFFVDCIEDAFNRFYETYEDTYFDGDPREMVDLLFEEDSYKEGYHNIDSFYIHHACSDEYSLFEFEQVVVIKIVNDKLKIVYNKKGKTKYYKDIKRFNKKGHKFALQKERLKNDNNEWYYAFQNKYYFRDEKRKGRNK